MKHTTNTHLSPAERQAESEAEMLATITPRIVDVEVANWEHGDGLIVSAIWADVDRPNVGGVVVKNRAMADRLVAAINAGVIFEGAEVLTDVNGATYVGATRTVRGRAMSADLRRLGF